MAQFNITILIDAETTDEADQWARGIVFPSEPIDWDVEECL